MYLTWQLSDLAQPHTCRGGGGRIPLYCCEIMNNNTRVNILQSKSSIPVNSNLKISYHGKTIAQACAEGNVPLTAMLIAEGVS